MNIKQKRRKPMNAEGKRGPNRLKRDLAAGKVSLGATITFYSPVIAEILSRIGLDWLWYDTEHTYMTLENVITMLQATNGANISNIVRVPWNDKTMIKKALETGPEGIIVPLVRTKEDAENAVRAMKYPTWGVRGAGLSRAQCYGLHMGEYMQTADEEVMTILQIEHIDAVNNIDEILSVKGVDACMIGALDLSGSMGMLGQTTSPEVEAAVQKVLAACKKAKVPCGNVTITPEDTNKRIEQGFQLLIMGIDVLFLHGAALNALSQIKR
jgi:2-keto-3-deoxy-L-rhamnonate aldolase RhmA